MNQKDVSSLLAKVIVALLAVLYLVIAAEYVYVVYKANEIEETARAQHLWALAVYERLSATGWVLPEPPGEKGDTEAEPGDANDPCRANNREQVN